MNPTGHCHVCQTPLSGRQKRFCSRRCKNADTNHRHQSYLQQQLPGWRRKRELSAESGAKYGKCGYGKNLAALVWHHLDPAGKSFSLDIRSLSNRRETEIRLEIDKCVVLCANCHAETHHPQFDVEMLRAETNEPALRRVQSSKGS